MTGPITANPLSGVAVDVMGQLYVFGPTWDGNVLSKAGRDELCRVGLVFHEHGYASLTPEGVRVAIEWDLDDLRKRHKQRWLQKLRAS